MNKSKSLIKALPLAIAVCGSILISTAEPASAFWRRKTEYLGRATHSDYSRYARENSDLGGLAMSVNPGSKTICRWKYSGYSGYIYGKTNFWSKETNCYRRYWTWFWR